ncbi:alpha/beta hydrolase [Halanaerobium salsuginis]|uniref:Dienelactone hydrolase domain-containing protein n=1 Tax=Halanaerobium salsuginis TaxID=29563 RepID=A0A1I4N5U5_9FIRM|nr:alpha/beta hydrolase [Halanaerobium salsuginis]SFM10633.1 hypothetical protein SAMN02983006_02813 [Halanaerobium salsuginis]
MKKMFNLLVAALVLVFLLGTAAEASDYYTFKLSDQVTRTHVRYKNRYNITIAADLYRAKDLNKLKSHPALVIGPPYGGVKEQGPGVYANQLAQRGFVVLAFDPSFNGESGGEPRHVSSPDFFVEDFSAGVDFLGTVPYVDRERIGAIGICGSGGFSLTAAQVDKRIKAVATASMYDISRYIRDGLGETMTAEQRDKILEKISQQRWHDFENGGVQVKKPSFDREMPLKKVPEGLNPVAAEFFDYYATARGYHPNSIGVFTDSSKMAFMNFPLLTHLEDISPRPILLIIGENAHSNYFSESVYKKAAEPKELYVVSGANHVDLYDRVDLIPFDKLEKFFKENI